MDSVKDVLDSIPEVFADLIAYILPAIYFYSGMWLIYSRPRFNFPDSAVIQIATVVLIIGCFYVTGQVFTSVSSVIQIILEHSINKIPRLNIIPQRDMDEVLGLLSKKRPEWYLAMTKRVSKYKASRNILLSNIIIGVWSYFLFRFIAPIYYVVLIFSIIDVLYRYVRNHQYARNLLLNRLDDCPL